MNVRYVYNLRVRRHVVLVIFVCAFVRVRWLVQINARKDSAARGRCDGLPAELRLNVFAHMYIIVGVNTRRAYVRMIYIYYIRARAYRQRVVRVADFKYSKVRTTFVGNQRIDDIT